MIELYPHIANHFQDRPCSRSPHIHPLRRSTPLPAGFERPETRQLNLSLANLFSLLRDAFRPDHQ